MSTKAWNEWLWSKKRKSNFGVKSSSSLKDEFSFFLNPIVWIIVFCSQSESYLDHMAFVAIYSIEVLKKTAACNSELSNLKVPSHQTFVDLVKQTPQLYIKFDVEKNCISTNILWTLSQSESKHDRLHRNHCF